ncbi:MAG: hypothetical protein IJY43_01720 [Clostridia bacterium]|nr:hypothetical protein [Clostridia bacterium]
MKKMTVCILTVALLLTALLCVGVFTASAEDATPCTSAAGCTGTYENGICSADATHYEAPTLNNNGTEADTTDDYYEIGNAGELYWFVALCDSIDRGTADDIRNEDDDTYYYEYFIPYNAVLTADITLNENVIVNGALNADTEGLVQWDPIGFYEYDGECIFYVGTYTGTFDGKGHTISGLYFNDTSAAYIGMFAAIGENGTVKDLTIEDACLHTRFACAILVYRNDGTVSGCTTKGIVKLGDDQYLVAGIACDNYGLIDGCINYASVFGEGYTYFLGGICCQNMGSVKNSANFGTIGAANNYQIGGILHVNEGTVENCYNSSPLRNSTTGGIVTYNQPDGIITNCYYNNELFAGREIEYQRGTVTDVAGKTAAEFESGAVCTLVGFHAGGTATCSQKAECEACGAEYGDLVHTSKKYINGFRSCCGEYQPAVQNGVGTNGMPLYEISNAGQLYWFAELVNKNESVAGYSLSTRHLNAKLVSDITVNEGRFDESGSYTPVNGEEPRPWTAMIGYQGHFDGNHKTISGLYLGNGGSGVGFFSSLGELVYEGGDRPTSGSIRNLGITNSYFAGASNVAVLAGTQYLGTSIENCWSDAFVKGSSSIVGGLVGLGRGGVLKNSIFYGVITNHQNYPNTANIVGATFPIYQVINSYSPYGENDWHDATDQPDYKKWYKSREAFASGEVAVLLNNAIGYHYFGQLLGTDQGPVIGGPAVYENVQLNCTEYGYSNSPVGNQAHIPASAWSYDGAEHWHACTVEGCDEKLDRYSHAYDHGCDANCNVCAAPRETAHVYDNACDTACNVCAATRETAHVYDNNCDTACNVCNEARETAHVYDNACDTACNVCNGARETAHVYDNACDTACNVCNEARTVGAHSDADKNKACDTCAVAVEGDGLPGGAGIGIGVGATVVVVLGGFSLFWFVIKRKSWGDLLGIFK